MAKLITTTTIYHPNLDFTDSDKVTVKEFKTKAAALSAGKKAFDKFLTQGGDCDPEDFCGSYYGFDELNKSPNSAFANDEDAGVCHHWYVID